MIQKCPLLYDSQRIHKNNGTDCWNSGEVRVSEMVAMVYQKCTLSLIIGCNLFFSHGFSKSLLIVTKPLLTMKLFLWKY